MAVAKASSKGILRSPYFWAIAIRMLMMVVVPRQLQGDAGDYEQLATNIANGHGFSRCFSEPFVPTAQRPPLYPLILALVYKTGINHSYGAILLNLLFDLITMWIAKQWGESLRFKWSKFIPWVIGLCPLLITYGMYPSSENISITLFFVALFLTSRMWPVAAGLMWGILSLGRSYFLLFPVFLWFFSPSKRWKMKDLTVMALLSFLAPGLWMIRNVQSVDRFAFSQTATVGWQSYQGLCYPNFDWWNPQDLSSILNDPIVSQMTRTHCSSQDEIEAIDQQIKQLTYQCVTAHPVNAARNVLIKGIQLFTNWGLVLPYNRVPFVVQNIINAVLLFYWWCVIRVLAMRRKGNEDLEASIRFSLVCIGYIALVTLPFAVDARYLLGPFLSLLICVFEIVKTPRKLVEAGLFFSAG